MKFCLAFIFILISAASCTAQKNASLQKSNSNPATDPDTYRDQDPKDQIIAGADRINVYLPLIKGKRVGVFANQTSGVGNKHLIDT